MLLLLIDRLKGTIVKVQYNNSFSPDGNGNPVVSYFFGGTQEIAMYSRKMNDKNALNFASKIILKD